MQNELDEMDPVIRMWMFHSWFEDEQEKAELLKQLGYLVGSFINPEAVRKLSQAQHIASSEEDFEKTSEMVSQINQESAAVAEISKPRRRRKKGGVNG